MLMQHIIAIIAILGAVFIGVLLRELEDRKMDKEDDDA